MAHDQNNINDPLNFVRGMWGNMGFSLPGMVAPTFDEEELEQRINDLKTVEGWLRMNLSMLQMTIQGLEMQKTTITAVKAVGTMASNAMQAGQPEAGGTPAPQDDSASQAAGAPAQDPGLVRRRRRGFRRAGFFRGAAPGEVPHRA